MLIFLLGIGVTAVFGAFWTAVTQHSLWLDSLSPLVLRLSVAAMVFGVGWMAGAHWGSYNAGVAIQVGGMLLAFGCAGLNLLASSIAEKERVRARGQKQDH